MLCLSQVIPESVRTSGGKQMTENKSVFWLISM